MKSLLTHCFILLFGCWAFAQHNNNNNAPTFVQPKFNTAIIKDRLKSMPPAGVTFLEDVIIQKGKINIPYKKYQLENGLTILLHEDHSDPIVYVDVTFHVGSDREQQGRSGFAHFFEHMMFQGSKHIADDEHFKIITESGGTLNGTTNSDRTNYFEVIPSNQLEKILWMEADRMGFLLDSVTQKKFEIQRATVKNERGQRYDNAPYGLASEKIAEALFPKGHPYSWQTIGYIEDLNRVDVNDLKRFYMRWYGPNNAVLTIAGDIDIQQTLKWILKYFGSIPKGPEVKNIPPTPVVLSETHYISYEDNIKFPMLRVSFPTVHQLHPDAVALDFLSDILSSGKSSPLYQKFIKKGRAVAASSFNYSRELAGQFEFVIRANPNDSLSKIEKLLYQILDEWEKNGGATEQDVKKLQTKYISDLYEQLYTVQSKGSRLAYYQTFMGTANYLPIEIEKIKQITAKDVMRVYHEYIKGKNKVVLSIVPKDKINLKAAEDNWKMYNRTIETESEDYKNLTYTEPKDTFNRATMPLPSKNISVPAPIIKQGTTKFNAPYSSMQENEIPKTKLLISFKAGHRYESMDKAGTASLLASIMKESTTKYSAEKIDEKLNSWGSDINISVNAEDIQIYISALTENLDSTINILKEIILSPKFDTTEFRMVVKRKLDAVQQGKVTATTIASNVFDKLYYGKSNIMSMPLIGDEVTLKNITIQDLKDYYKKMISSNNINISIISDLQDNQKIITKLSFLSSLPNNKITYTEPITPTITQTKIYFVDKPGAAQSEIIFGTLGLPFDAVGNYFKCNVMNFPFAGAFNSRINYLLREQKGYTYGVRGRFYGNAYSGEYLLSGGFKKDATDSTLKLIRQEFETYIKFGITANELNFTKSALLQSDALKLEAPIQKLYFLKNIMDYKLSSNYMEMQRQILQIITKDELDGLIKKVFDSNKMIIVVVGDKKTVFEKINNLGMPVIELDASGNLLK